MITDIEPIYDLSGSGKYSSLHRVNYEGKRLYVQSNPFRYFSGLTGALSAATFKGDPEARRLEGWRKGMIDSFGAKRTDEYVTATADFGTLLHMALVRIKDNGKIDWKDEADIAAGHFAGMFTDQVLRQTIFEYQKHVASLLQFIYERVTKIHAIEVPAIWNGLAIATPIDLVCECRSTPKADPVTTTVNIKTSSQISAGHIEQVSCELVMWNETYPEQEAQVTAIMRTKDWTEGKTATYELKYLPKGEAEVIAWTAANRLRLCLDSPASYLPSPTSKHFRGETKLGDQPEIILTDLEAEWAEGESINHQKTLWTIL